MPLLPLIVFQREDQEQIRPCKRKSYKKQSGLKRETTFTDLMMNFGNDEDESFGDANKN